MSKLLLLFLCSNGVRMIGVGFSSAKASLDKLPGWELESWAYHGDDGKSFCCQNTGVPYGPTFTAGDVVGCGINFMSGTAFFTKNGVFQGYYNQKFGIEGFAKKEQGMLSKISRT